MICKIFCAAALAVFCLAQSSSAQWQLTPQYDETPSNWSSWSSGESSSSQGYGWRPYVPYPGQPGNPNFGVIPQSIQPLSQQAPLSLPSTQYEPPLPSSFDSGITSSEYLSPTPQPSNPIETQQSNSLGSEVIISEEPIQGKILGVVQEDGTLLSLDQFNANTKAAATAQNQSTTNPESMSGPRDNFGIPVVQPGESNNIVILESVPEPSKLETPTEDLESDLESNLETPTEELETPSKETDPGNLASNLDAVAPSMTPAEAVEKRIKEEASMEKAAEEAAAKTGNYDIRIARMTNALEEAQTRIKEQDKAIAELEKKRRVLERRAKAQTEELAERTEKDQKLVMALQEAETQLVERDKAIAAFKEQKRVRDRMMRAQTKRVEKPTMSAEALSKLKKAGDEELARMKKKNKSLLADIKSWEEKSKQQSDANSEASKLRKKLVQTNRDMVGLRREIDDANLKIENLRIRNKSRLASDVKLKAELSKSRKANGALETAIAAMKKQMGDMPSSKEKSSKAAESMKRMEKILARSKKENTTMKKELDESTKLLRKTKSKLAAQEKKYSQLKSKFMEAFEAEKGKSAEKKARNLRSDSEKSMTEPELREQRKRMREKAARKAREMKKEKDQKEKKAKSKKEDREKKETNKKAEKERKLERQKKDLIEEMKKKMAESAARIRGVGKKKIDALIKDGKKEDSDEVTKAQERIDESVKIANRKIRARYERRLKRMK